MSLPSNSLLRIIGVGSPYATDAIGLHAVERLQQEPRLSSLPYQWEFIALDRPGSMLLNHFEGADSVVLVDAMLSETKVGSVRRLSMDELLRQGSVPSSHNLGVAEALALAEALEALPERLFVYGIEVSETAHPMQWYEPLLSLLLHDINAFTEQR